MNEIKEKILKICYNQNGGYNSVYSKEIIWKNKGCEKTLEEIFKITDFMPINAGIYFRIFFILNDIFKTPKCAKCEKEFIKIRDGKLLKYCSVECSSQHTIKAVRDTFMKKYGVDSPSKIKSLMDKARNTIMSKINETNNKIKQTKLKRYNNTSYNNVEKSKESCVKKFGNDYGKIIAENVKKSQLEKTGYDHPLKDPSRKEDILAKTKITNIKKYGEECNLLINLENSINNKGMKWKEYILPSGKIIKVQGYEPKALDELLEVYSEEDIITEAKNKPKIYYVGTDGKQHRYFPDIWIPKSNLIVEVKSEYTYNYDLETNLLKKEACLKAGLNFEFRIY